MDLPRSRKCYQKSAVSRPADAERQRAVAPDGCAARLGTLTKFADTFAVKFRAVVLLIQRVSALFLLAIYPQIAGAVDVALTGVDLHTLGRVVFGEIKVAGYELPDELAQEKTVSVSWRGSEGLDLVKRYRALIESRGYTVKFSDGVYAVVRRVDHVDVFTAHNRSLVDILGMLSGYPGVSVRSRSSVVPGAETKESSGDLVRPGAAHELNTVVVSGELAKVAAWKEAARSLDVAPDAVQIKAAVFEVALSDGDSSAVKLAGSVLQRVTGWTLGGDTDKGSLSVGIGGLSLTVSHLVKDGRFRLLSEPHVSVVSGESARLAVGTKIPVLGETTTTDAGRQTQSVRYVDSGVVLDVSPVRRGARWEVAISQELSSVQPVAGVAGNPLFNSRSVRTRLRGSVGDVLVLAGLDTSEKSDIGTRSFGIFGGRDHSGGRSQILLLLELQDSNDLTEQKRQFVEQNRKNEIQ